MTFPSTARPAVQAESLPASVVVISILLILISLLKTGFMVTSLLRVPTAMFSIGIYLVLNVVVPALVDLGGIATAILAFCRLPAARAFGITFCAIALAYQIFSIAALTYILLVRGTFNPSWVIWIWPPIYVIVYLAGIVIFARWQPRIRF